MRRTTHKTRGRKQPVVAESDRFAVPEGVYPLRTPEDQGWKEFREQCRRQMQRPVAERIRYGFYRPIHPSTKPIIRIFKTMADYRKWCDENLPDYLGYKRPAK